MERAEFGTVDGRPVALFTLRSARGIVMRVAELGGVLVSLQTPDRAGRLDDIVLGFGALAPYTTGTAYFGALIGRYGNRIARGTFTLDGRTYALATNDGAHHLHGGVRGFDKVLWQAEPFERADGRGLVLRYTSPAGEEGYPGTLQARVTYTLTDADELAIDYHATTDAATPVNLTHHGYFNLAGERGGDILDHVLTIAASTYTPVDEALIPTGEMAPVEGTPFDFRTPMAIGARIDADHVQLRYGLGYDHNWVLDGEGGALALAARVVHPGTGRTLEVRTTEPGMQFYSGNRLDGSVRGKHGRAYGRRAGFCLETQHYPDSPNRPAFPSAILRPGETYRTRTEFAFGVADAAG